MSGFVTLAPGSAVSSSRGRAAVSPQQKRPELRNARSMARMVDFAKIGEEFEDKETEPTEIIDYALDQFPGEVGIAFSGAEDVVLIEHAKRTGKPFRVFSLDTGRLHPETYKFYYDVEKYFGIKIEYVFPEREDVENLVNEKGLFSFYEDGHKVKPLRKKLGTLKAWITGQRRDQSPSTRSYVATVEVDGSFKGTGGEDLIKFNPLANVSSAEVWSFIRMTGIPSNPLHQDGFISIGCEPCTARVLPNQHEREGRWWWEEDTLRECGLHEGNVRTPAP